MGFRINYNSTISIDGIPYLWSFGYSPTFDKTGGTDLSGDFVSSVFVATADNDDTGSKFISGELSTISGYKLYYLTDNREKLYSLYYNGSMEEGYYQSIPDSLLSTEFNGIYDNPTSIRELISFFDSTSYTSNYGDGDASFSPIVFTEPSRAQERYGYKIAASAGIVVVSAIKSTSPKLGLIEIRDTNDVLTSYGVKSNPTNNLLFGSAIAISPDRKLAVGAEGIVGGEGNATYDSKGAVILYDTSTTLTTTTVNSVIIGNASSARFGASLGILKTTSSSSFQNKLFIGIPGQSSNTGQVNVYNMDSLMSANSGLTPSEYTTQRIAQITPSSLGYSGDPSRFGETIAVGDGIVAISAPAYAESGVVRGAVFLVNPKDHTLIKKIVCPAVNDITGFITNYVGNGTTSVTCNLNTSDVVTAGQMIEITGAVGTEQSKLNGTWVVATASSTSFTFLISQNLSSGTYSISSNNLGYTRLMKGNSEFGFSIAIGSGRIVIGDPYSDNVGNNSGYAYIYDYSGNLISARSPAYFSSSGYGVDNEALFGHSVAIGNGKIFIGSPKFISYGIDPFNDTAYIRKNGMIQVFSLDGSFIQGGFPPGNQIWSTSDILPNGRTYPYYTQSTRSGTGWSMACSNDNLYSGAPESNALVGTVVEYRKMTRAYTPYTAVELQKGLI